MKCTKCGNEVVQTFIAYSPKQGDYAGQIIRIQGEYSYALGVELRQVLVGTKFELVQIHLCYDCFITKPQVLRI